MVLNVCISNLLTADFRSNHQDSLLGPHCHGNVDNNFHGSAAAVLLLVFLSRRFEDTGQFHGDNTNFLNAVMSNMRWGLISVAVVEGLPHDC